MVKSEEYPVWMVGLYLRTLRPPISTSECLIDLKPSPHTCKCTGSFSGFFKMANNRLAALGRSNPPPRTSNSAMWSNPNLFASLAVCLESVLHDTGLGNVKHSFGDSFRRTQVWFVESLPGEQASQPLVLTLRKVTPYNVGISGKGRSGVTAYRILLRTQTRQIQSRP